MLLLFAVVLPSCFPQDEFSLLVEKWNAQRAKAVAHALLKVLYPLMVKELRIKLLDEAKEHVLQVCLALPVHILCRYLGRGRHKRSSSFRCSGSGSGICFLV